jgi:hypothetical protein
MSHRALGRHLRSHWLSGTLSSGWVYRGASLWGCPAGPRPKPARMAELAIELIEPFPELGFAGNVVRVWCWGEVPIIVDT